MSAWRYHNMPLLLSNYTSKNHGPNVFPAEKRRWGITKVKFNKIIFEKDTALLSLDLNENTP